MSVGVYSRSFKTTLINFSPNLSSSQMLILFTSTILKRARGFFLFFLRPLYWMKHFSLRLAVMNVSSELLLSAHLPTSEGWTAELTVCLWLVVPMTGFESMRVDLA